MYCPECGKKIPNESRFCMYCGCKLDTDDLEFSEYERPAKAYNYNGDVPTKKKGGCLKTLIILVIIAILVVFLYVVVNSVIKAVPAKSESGDANVNNTTEVTDEQTEKPKVSAKKYKKSCKEYSYDKISRNPDKYKGKHAKFTGEVVQVQEYEAFGVSINYYRVNVTKKKYDFTNIEYYDDTIYVEYHPKDGARRILEGDIITIWGELDGLESYTSIAGYEITIPKMKAEYIKRKTS